VDDGGLHASETVLNAREAGETGRRIAAPDILPATIQHANGTLYASGLAFSLEEERQPKIWKSRVTSGEERLIATMPGTLFALFRKGG
jgi:hypothetical protein